MAVDTVVNVVRYLGSSSPHFVDDALGRSTGREHVGNDEVSVRSIGRCARPTFPAGSCARLFLC